jgi:hypothetical protein
VDVLDGQEPPCSVQVDVTVGRWAGGVRRPARQVEGTGAGLGEHGVTASPPS